MKKVLRVIVLVALFSGSARSDDSTVMVTNSANPADISTSYTGRFGAGVIFGEPTGASLKFWLNDTVAIDGAVGASFNDNDDDDASFYMHSDLLWHNFALIPVPRGRLPVYLGGGGLVRFRHHDDNQVGVRVPVGLSYMFDSAPVDIFAEVAPAIDISPGVRGEITGGIGIRFWF